MGLIRVLDLVDRCYNSEDGEVIHEAIVARLPTEFELFVSLDGVDSVPSSFVNVAFVRLLERMSFEEIKKRVHFVNTNSQINEMIKSRFTFEARRQIDFNNSLKRLGKQMDAQELPIGVPHVISNETTHVTTTRIDAANGTMVYRRPGTDDIVLHLSLDISGNNPTHLVYIDKIYWNFVVDGKASTEREWQSAVASGRVQFQIDPTARVVSITRQS
jgi:hypothetical protein